MSAVFGAPFVVPSTPSVEKCLDLEPMRPNFANIDIMSPGDATEQASSSINLSPLGPTAALHRWTDFARLRAANKARLRTRVGGAFIGLLVGAIPAVAVGLGVGLSVGARKRDDSFVVSEQQFCLRNAPSLNIDMQDCITQAAAVIHAAWFTFATTPTSVCNAAGKCITYSNYPQVAVFMLAFTVAVSVGGGLALGVAGACVGCLLAGRIPARRPAEADVTDISDLTDAQAQIVLAGHLQRAVANRDKDAQKLLLELGAGNGVRE